MSLPLLVAIVAVGIALIVAAVHLTGGSRRATIASAEQAVERFREDFPGETVGTVRLTRSAETAFLELNEGRVGIVHAVGDRFLTRALTPRDVASCSRVGEAGLSVRLSDFTFTGGNFDFGDRQAADAVAARLAPARIHAVEAAR